MLVQDVMTKHVICTKMDESLDVVRDLLSSRRIHHLVVLDENKIVGIVSDRDVLRHLSPFSGTNSERTIDAATLRKRVHQIMSRHVQTVRFDMPAVDAAKLLLERGISCVPVVGETGGLLGIVTTRDLLRCAVTIGCFSRCAA
jgi:acetoin utilization protein AcuB